MKSGDLSSKPLGLRLVGGGAAQEVEGENERRVSAIAPAFYRELEEGVRRVCCCGCLPACLPARLLHPRFGTGKLTVCRALSAAGRIRSSARAHDWERSTSGRPARVFIAPLPSPASGQEQCDCPDRASAPMSGALPGGGGTVVPRRRMALKKRASPTRPPRPSSQWRERPRPSDRARAWSAPGESQATRTARAATAGSKRSRRRWRPRGVGLGPSRPAAQQGHQVVCRLPPQPPVGRSASIGFCRLCIFRPPHPPHPPPQGEH